MATTLPTSAMREQANDVVLVRQCLRTAIDQSGWKQEALAAAMSERLHPRRIDGPHLSKMLSGKKAITARHLRALPDDVEAVFARLYAESFGLMVVVPAESDKALTAFVSGLAGLLGAKLPARANRMAQADLPGEQRRTA